MGENSKIEWTTHTFNPWAGCTRVSPACENCYAETDTKRYGYVDWGPRATRRVVSEATWRNPIKWNNDAHATGVRARVFCASWADVFEDRPEVVAARIRLWHLIDQTPHLDWLLLTKRPQNIGPMIPVEWRGRWPANVWLGTTVEDQRRAEERIPHLAEHAAVVRFLSVEPLLGEVDLRRYLGTVVDWVLVGGESGAKSRPMQPAWARSVRDQCVRAGVALHFKQWGEFGDQLIRLGKKNAGRTLDGRTWDELPTPRRAL